MDVGVWVVEMLAGSSVGIVVGSGGQRSRRERWTCGGSSRRAERERTREMHSWTASGTKGSLQVPGLKAAWLGSVSSAFSWEQTDHLESVGT